MKSLFFLLLTATLSTGVSAQPQRDSILATVNNLFIAMKTGDTVLLKKCFSPTAVLQSVKDTKGDITVINEDIAGFISFIGKETPGSADERIEVETVKIDGPLAVVWTPYQFYYKGKFSHCGVNSFQLARLGGEWKIQYLVDTRRKAGCK